ncbi:hypothetical protein [Kalamiella sp. sgz302252]|uniref:hypothetical protein n=1 Tax=Pantoea sp. sgz302252 TaxID=3341827 RepID=UPI0036D32A04
MLLRVLPIMAVVLLSACSSGTNKHAATKTSGETKQTAAVNPQPVIKYSRGNSKIVPVNPVISSNNQCVDHFNFLRQAGEKKYHKYSQDYIKIGEGYSFLNVNKNIMDNDAKRVYTMKLDMKLDTLCSVVNYAGYKVIQEKIKELYDI